MKIWTVFQLDHPESLDMLMLKSDNSSFITSKKQKIINNQNSYAKQESNGKDRNNTKLTTKKY